VTIVRILTDDEARRLAGLKPAPPMACWAIFEGSNEPQLIRSN
jgi:hypothetical protein